MMPQSRFLLHSNREPTSMADEDDIERIPINRLRQEEGAHELATSPDMVPYLDFAMG
jgi:hypothetical protein